MFDAQRLLGAVLSEGLGRGGAGGVLGSVLGGRSRRRRGGQWTLQAGLGLAGLAMAAWEHYAGDEGDAGRPPPAPPRGNAPPPAPRGPTGEPGGGAAPLASRGPPPLPAAVRRGGAPAAAPPPVDGGTEARALLGLRCMLAAMLADGELDDDERARLLGRLQAAGLEAEARRFIEQELAAPASVEALAAQVHDAAQAEELYALALLAIDVDTAAELAFMAELGRALGLDEQRRRALQASVTAARTP